MWYPSEARLKLKSRKISFVLNIYFSSPIVFDICTEYDSGIVALFAKTWNDVAIK